MALLTIVVGILLVVPTAYWVQLRLPKLRPLVEGVEDSRHATFSQEGVEPVATAHHPYDRARLHPCCLPVGNHC